MGTNGKSVGRAASRFVPFEFGLVWSLLLFASPTPSPVRVQHRPASVCLVQTSFKCREAVVAVVVEASEAVEGVALVQGISLPWASLSLISRPCLESKARRILCVLSTCGESTQNL